MGLSSPGELYDLAQADQDEALRHWEKAQAQCPHCKRPRSLCSDPNVTWYPQQSICFATQAQAWAQSAWAAKHEAAPWCDFTMTSWSKKQDEQHPHRFDHGVEIWVDTVDHDPDNHFMDAKALFVQPAVLRASQYAYRGDNEADHEGDGADGAED